MHTKSYVMKIHLLFISKAPQGGGKFWGRGNKPEVINIGMKAIIYAEALLAVKNTVEKCRNAAAHRWCRGERYITIIVDAIRMQGISFVLQNCPWEGVSTPVHPAFTGIRQFLVTLTKLSEVQPQATKSTSLDRLTSDRVE